MAKEMSRTGQRGMSRGAGGDPLRNVIGLRDTINGMFEDFFRGRPVSSSFGETSLGAQGWVPPVDICDEGDQLVVYAGLLGIKKEDVRIEVQDSTLMLSGECKEPSGEGKDLLRHELPCGEFQRAFSLPAEVKSDQVKASYHDGLLEIRLPKAEAPKARRIEIH
ncbi:MAG TPA: Hsp20/alpha crystallin family protein [Elusimicrobiota bacterium]|jgi:HSP20 family protein|nr:Hsp20/alpha crystallin family protein [Elusimicrobiota bacterium]